MTNNKFGWYLLSIISLFEGISSALGYKIYLKYNGGWTTVSYDYTMYITILGLLFFYKAYTLKEKQEKYTKCPKCKEVFNYQELKDGKCKYCKEIDTIELEKYYKKYPKEKDDDS